MISSAEIMAQRLSKMVQFPTVSFPDEKEMNFESFAGFQAYIEETYPNVHKVFKKEIVGRAGLLYHWKSENPQYPPVMFTTHQDVVPANETNWTYPPFSGTIADGFVWGRGSSDSKSLLLAHMETMEALIEEGFSPKFDIYLAYGYNEEVGGGLQGSSAKMTCELLKSKGVHLGILIDEGGFIVDGKSFGVDGKTALIYIAEKGCATYKVFKKGTAGHTAIPPEINTVADVARALVKIDERPIDYRMTPAFEAQLKSIAPYSGENRELFENPYQNLEAIRQKLKNDRLLSANMSTTVSMTMLQGSTTPTTTPSETSAMLNVRTLQGDTLASVLKELQDLAAPYAEVTLESGREASPVSDIHCEAFRILSESIRQEHPGCVVLPSNLPAGTDARFYYPICDCVLRFTGFEDRLQEGKGGHCADERFAINTIDTSSKLFYRFLKNYQAHESGTEGELK